MKALFICLILMTTQPAFSSTLLEEAQAAKQQRIVQQQLDRDNRTKDLVAEFVSRLSSGKEITGDSVRAGDYNIKEAAKFFQDQGFIVNLTYSVCVDEYTIEIRIP